MVSIVFRIVLDPKIVYTQTEFCASSSMAPQASCVRNLGVTMGSKAFDEVVIFPFALLYTVSTLSFLDSSDGVLNYIRLKTGDCFESIVYRALVMVNVLT